MLDLAIWLTYLFDMFDFSGEQTSGYTIIYVLAAAKQL